MNKEQVELIENAIGTLQDLAIRDCMCDDYDVAKTDDRRFCESCRARDAVRDLERALTPNIESLQPGRMRNYSERIFVEQFRKECVAEPGVNGGWGLLELILVPDSTPISGFGHPQHVPHVSQRDAHVAASVIQWLGTSCGRAFIHTCERKIDAERQGMNEVEGLPGMANNTPWRNPPSTSIQATAERIATAFISIDKHPKAVEQLQLLIASAIKHYEQAAEERVGVKSVCYDM